MSIRLTTTARDGDVIVHAVDEWYSRFKDTLDLDNTELRGMDTKVRTLIVNVVDTIINPTESSIYQLAVRATNSRKAYTTLLEQLVEFDHEMRELVKMCHDRKCDVTGVTIPHDKLILVFHMEDTRRPDETGFETYIESCRRSGEYVHPELDKQLRLWRSIRGA
jgi:hypothetical protein